MERLTANPTPHPLDAAARPLDLDAIKARRDAVMKLTFALASDGDKAFRMSIPLQQDDADVLLLKLCDDVDALLASVRGAEAETAKVTRFEVIDHRENPGYYRRTFVARPCRVELSYQDDGRTLKVFVDDAAGAHPPIQETDANASL